MAGKLGVSIGNTPISNAPHNDSRKLIRDHVTAGSIPDGVTQVVSDLSDMESIGELALSATKLSLAWR